MPDQEFNAEERAVDAALRRVRPAAASSEFRQRMLALGPPATAALPAPFPAARFARHRLLFAAAGIAAAAAIALLVLRPGTPAPQKEFAVIPPALAPETPAKSAEDFPPAETLSASREVGLVRRGLAPPVQLLAVEEVRFARSGSSAGAVPPRLEASTRLVPVVLKYY